MNFSRFAEATGSPRSVRKAEADGTIVTACVFASHATLR